jgi:hypothetical protein
VTRSSGIVSRRFARVERGRFYEVAASHRLALREGFTRISRMNANPFRFLKLARLALRAIGVRENSRNSREPIFMPAIQS